MFSPSLPGKARAALTVLGVYLALSVIGIFQILGIRDHLSRSLRSTLDLIVLITVGIMAIFVVCAVLAIRKYSATPLMVITSISLVFSLFNLRNGMSLSLIITLGMLIAMICLLGSAEVRDYFAARKYERASATRPVLSEI